MAETRPAAGAPATGHAEHEPFQPIAGLAAIALPGLGHAVLGEYKRAIYIASGVLGMFFGGLFIGGIDVVDKQEDFAWFLAQSCVGPMAFGINALHQSQFKAVPEENAEQGEFDVRRSGYPNEVKETRRYQLPGGNTRTIGVWRPLAQGERGGPPSVKSVGRVNELGTLFAAIAGMMNAICIVDASFRRRARERKP